MLPFANLQKMELHNLTSRTRKIQEAEQHKRFWSPLQENGVIFETVPWMNLVLIHLADAEEDSEDSLYHFPCVYHLTKLIWMYFIKINLRSM